MAALMKLHKNIEICRYYPNIQKNYAILKVYNMQISCIKMNKHGGMLTCQETSGIIKTNNV